ncbi:hypothetical protein AB837_00336 [bacterium AB1]|nr:hypothetical protein AB837_00336 [bacterium AB1]
MNTKKISINELKNYLTSIKQNIMSNINNIQNLLFLNGVNPNHMVLLYKALHIKPISILDNNDEDMVSPSDLYYGSYPCIDSIVVGFIWYETLISFLLNLLKYVSHDDDSLKSYIHNIAKQLDSQLHSVSKKLRHNSTVTAFSSQDVNLRAAYDNLNEKK